MLTTRSIAAFSASAFVALLLSGCASTPVTEENAVVHHVSEAETQAAHRKEKLQGTSAVLWVNGLGCPQCATNADLQLKRISGVSNIQTDLSTGKISISMLGGDKNPTAKRVSDAIEDAGFTIVKIKPN